MISYSLALVATTESRTDQLEWTSYLILTCPGTCIDTTGFVLCLLFMISSYRCIIHHESLSRTRCDRRYHANPTRIGCLIRRRRSYLCSRRFGEHSALIDVLGIFWLPASRSNGCWRVGSWYNDDVWKTVQSNQVVLWECVVCVGHANFRKCISRCLFSSLFMIPLTSCVFKTFSYLWTVHALNCATRETNRVYLTTWVTAHVAQSWSLKSFVKLAWEILSFSP